MISDRKRVKRIPEPTVRRLSVYLRYLRDLKKSGVTIVSSAQLARKSHVNPAQVRKDLSYFGEFGFRGVGYYVDELIERIENVLGLNRIWNMCIVGMGNLGRALYLYQRFLEENYKIVAAFDKDPSSSIAYLSERLGKPVEIFHISSLPEVSKERNISIAILTVPPDEAQKVADLVVSSGIRGILNFTPAHITVPEGFHVKNVLFTPLLDNLIYLINLSSKSSEVDGGKENK